MIFPEHMEFRYYITPERKEHFALYDKTLGSRMTYLDQTQDLGQCLIDLYDADFYEAYCRCGTRRAPAWGLGFPTG